MDIKNTGLNTDDIFMNVQGLKNGVLQWVFWWSRGDSGDLDTNGLHGNTIWL